MLRHIAVVHSRTGGPSQDQERVNGHAPPSNPHGTLQTNSTLAAVQQVLLEKNYRVSTVPATPILPADLWYLKAQLVFNLATGITSKKEQAHVASLLEVSGLPFTGPGALAHLLGLSKPLAKKIFAFHGLPTAAFQEFHDPKEDLVPSLSFPLIVKPSQEGSSLGIGKDSVVWCENQLRDAVASILTTYRQPALVEEFLPGREFTVGVLGNNPPSLLPIEEIIFDPSQERFYSYEVKSRDTVIPRCPAEIDTELAREIETVALKAYEVIGARDFARLDIRLDANGRPKILEINTLPGLMPGYSEFPRMAAAAGLSYADLIGRIVQLAWERSPRGRPRVPA
ncbi:MAG: hypothetical protein M1299_10190 [Firmicutes bacterium]|nr:hypothetical protein [Bacillota bacterium]MCL5040176.1 hypothetical protein [Bacillota bacterium]